MSTPSVVPDGGDDTYLSTAKVTARYGISMRTVDRWLGDHQLGFPTPLVIQRKRYWSLRKLEAWERKRAALRAPA